MKRELELYSCNILKVSVETNTPMGGDTGHGGRTTFTLSDEGDTDIECNWDSESKKLEIRLGGDTECSTFIDCLKFAYLELSRQHIKNEYGLIKNYLESDGVKENKELQQNYEERLKQLKINFCDIIKELKRLEESYSADMPRWCIEGIEG